MKRPAQLLFALVLPLLTACEGIPLHLGTAPASAAAPVAAAPAAAPTAAGVGAAADGATASGGGWCGPGRVLYRLCGVVVHSGGLSSGHYVAHVRHAPEEGGAPEAWSFVSDSSVSASSLGAALGAQGYLLFYERVEG